MLQKIHLDTDLGGDTDDLCALALLLAWPDVEITGITTCLEEGGRRAGYVCYALSIAGRTKIPVAAGADGGLELENGWLVERIDPAGIRLPVATAVDGGRFNQFWLDSVAPDERTKTAGG